MREKKRRAKNFTVPVLGGAQSPPECPRRSKDSLAQRRQWVIKWWARSPPDMATAVMVTVATVVTVDMGMTRVVATGTLAGMGTLITTGATVGTGGTMKKKSAVPWWWTSCAWPPFSVPLPAQLSCSKESFRSRSLERERGVSLLLEEDRYFCWKVSLASYSITA